MVKDREEEEGKAHFSLKGILKDEKESSKKRRRKRKEPEVLVVYRVQHVISDHEYLRTS